jgi:hypothetical protein
VLDRRIAGALAVLGFGAVAMQPARAATEYVTNGGFEQATVAASSQFGDRWPSNQVTGWTSAGYTFRFTSGTADDPNERTQGDYPTTMWGPRNGANNGLTASSPAGGAFIASDGNYQQGPISQTITGLTAGAGYYLKFWWAAAQQRFNDGPTTEQWQVSFGNSTYNTAVVNTPDHGFVPWRQETVWFAATGPTQLLSFLSVGGPPGGQPPYALLDGVSLTAAPEPATWALVVVGMVGATVVLRRRRTGRGGLAAA